PYPRSATGTSTDGTRVLAPHQGAKLLADLLDQLVRGFGPVAPEPRLAAVHLRDPQLRELAGTDVLEDALHPLAHVGVDHARAAHVVAELRGVGDRPAHVLQAALPDEVDDQLELVQALVVRDLRLVAGGDERLEACPDQLGRPAAEDGLLAEEVG